MEIEFANNATLNGTAASGVENKAVDQLRILRQAMDLLNDGLRPFVEKTVYGALGEDFAEDFLPPRTCSTTDLLDFICQKWLGVFSDSAIANREHSVKALYKHVRSYERAMNPLPRKKTKEFLEEIERLLAAVRATGIAAQVARLIALSDGIIEDEQANLLLKRAKPQETMEVEKPEALFARTAPVPTFSSGSGGLIVLDGANIAWEHGNSKRFSPRGITEAYLYYVGRGHPTVVFLSRSRLEHSSKDPKDIADDAIAMNHLRSLEGSPALVLTPAKEYDDVYALYFAKRNGGLIVSNDRYSDMLHQAAADGEENEREWKEFLRACRIGFTFQGHDFMPNPHFDMERGTTAARHINGT